MSGVDLSTKLVLLQGPDAIHDMEETFVEIPQVGDLVMHIGVAYRVAKRGFFTDRLRVTVFLEKV